MMCVSVVDVYKDELKEGKCSEGKEWKELRSEREKEKGIRRDSVCESMCVSVIDVYEDELREKVCSCLEEWGIKEWE